MHFEYTNNPPRTSADKTIRIISIPHEGMMELVLYGSWSCYKPQEAEMIANAILDWVKTVIKWSCPFCFEDNFTTERENSLCGLQGYDWVRCQNCKKKTKREKLGLK